MKWKRFRPGDYVSLDGYRFKIVRTSNAWILVDMLNHWSVYKYESLVACKQAAEQLTELEGERKHGNGYLQTQDRQVH